MGGLAFECEVGAHIRQAAGGLNGIAVAGMPGIAGVQIIIVTVSRQEHFAPTSFFSRAAVISYCTFNAMSLHIVFCRNSSTQSSSTQCAVAAAMARSARFNGAMYIFACFLAQGRQGIKLAQDTDDGMATAISADERSGDAVNVFLYLKTLLFQNTDQRLQRIFPHGSTVQG